MLGTELVTRLAAFAKTGRPEAENLAPWSPFDGSSLYRIDAGVMQEVYPLTRIYINLEEFLLRELGALDKFFYYTSSGQGVTMDIRVTLTFKAPVNHQALLTAADEALRLFPEFSVQTVLKGSKLFYEENHNHAALLPSGTGYDFGTDDMNGYLFCFQADSAKPNEVVFSAYHGLSDWNGLRRFLKTIVCRYAVHVKGLPDDYFSGVIRSKAPDKSEWFNEANLNPYEFYARQDAVPSFKPEISGEIFTLPEENYSFDSPASRHIRITLSVSQFLKAAKSRSSSFVPYLLYLASNAVREAYSTDKNIFLALPADLRNVFNADTIVNFSESIFLLSSLQEHSAPADEQCRRFRDMITLQKKPENYAALLYDKSRRLRSYEAAPEGIFAKSRELITQTADLAKSVTLGITYNVMNLERLKRV